MKLKTRFSDAGPDADLTDSPKPDETVKVGIGFYGGHGSTRHGSRSVQAIR
jgi:hypothetical protein